MSHLSHHLTLRMKCSPETLWVWINKPLPAPHSNAGDVQLVLRSQPLHSLILPSISPVASES